MGCVFVKETIQGLALSQYIDDPSVTEEHRELTRATAQIFLRRVANIMPSEILKNPSHLLYFMREDFVKQQEYRDRTDARL